MMCGGRKMYACVFILQECVVLYSADLVKGRFFSVFFFSYSFYTGDVIESVCLMQ